MPASRCISPTRGGGRVRRVAAAVLAVLACPGVGRARQSDKPLTYSSSGVGSMGQLVAEYFAQKADIRIEHVPYKGASQGLTDLVGGHIAFSSQTVSSTAGQLHAGTLIGVAQTGKDRMPDFPTVPTFNELGYPDLIGTTWFSLSGPAGLPA